MIDRDTVMGVATQPDIRSSTTPLARISRSAREQAQRQRNRARLKGLERPGSTAPARRTTLTSQ
jgi:hypothetical protein